MLCIINGIIGIISVKIWDISQLLKCFIIIIIINWYCRLWIGLQWETKKKYTVYNRVFFPLSRIFSFFFCSSFFILYSFCFILCHVSIQVFSYTFELFSNWTISKFNLFLLSLSLSLHTHRLKTWCSSNVFCFEFSWWIVFFYFFVVEMVPVTYYIRFVELKFPIGNSRFLVKYNRYTHTLLLSQWLDENFSTDIDNERKKTGKKEEKKISDEIKWLN